MVSNLAGKNTFLSAKIKGEKRTLRPLYGKIERLVKLKKQATAKQL